MKELERHIHEFEPVFDKNSKILILGTFPSVKSREQAFYYSHPQNRFWRVISALTKSDVPANIAQKREMLIKNNIAVWDVISECDIIGSSDSSIKNVVPVDILKLLSQASIGSIYANGNAAKKLYEKYLMGLANREVVGLPSTSPANAAYSLERLIDCWSVIKTKLEKID